ncbi:MAG: chorismate synthase [bacterium]
MSKIKILTAGESHGKKITGIIEGLPSGLPLNREKINYQLQRRQKGVGRGGRMKIEKDQVKILSGVRFGTTMGSPITIQITNRDWDNWKKIMAVWRKNDTKPLTVPRPGHADLAGSIKYNTSDIRNILERASARETAVRVAIGSILQQFLELFGITVISQVISVHDITAPVTFRNLCEQPNLDITDQLKEMTKKARQSALNCCDPETEKKMIKKIKQIQKKGDSLGGSFEIAGLGVPVGLGSHISPDTRLDSIIAADMMSIPGIKSVEIGLGAESSTRLGSEMHDPIVPGVNGRPERSSNRAGGIEGGISNGEPIIVRAVMKPIPTLKHPLPSVDLMTGKAVAAHKERTDTCSVPSASVVGEAMLAISLGKVLCEKYGGDSVQEMRRYFSAYSAS